MSALLLSFLSVFLLCIATATLSVAFWLLSAARRQKADTSLAGDQVRLAIACGQLAHELQKERGLSTAHAGRSGNDGDKTLDDQRAVVSAVSTAFLAAAARSLDRTTALAAPLERCRDALETLPVLRQKVDGKAIAPPDVVEAYSAVVGQLLDLVRQIVRRTARGKVPTLGLAYINLITGKEYAGQERAVINGALSRQVLTDADRSRMRGLSQSQTLYLGSFRDLADEEIAAKLHAAAASPAFREVEALRQTLSRADAATALPSPADWFKAATARIDAFKQLEDETAQRLLAASNRRQGSAARSFRLSGALSSAAALCLTVMTAVFVLHGS
ncbi:nitrate- and nitrite sensing domain-containing protein [Telmatospirillum sp. J64-1]|uniref:nitrate- and nitrite sensing domain-containing protein n=1 Tax=Telmatospirillum sp. J64-1 TaxID=2502183 RepID=UPI00115DE356|nr:nitrate- and nitrite sensing domain-containing protein [Telmatospirillum sp. J64-1]